MSVGNISKAISTIIKSYMKTRKGKQDFDWLQKNHPDVANIITKGLKFADYISDATSLDYTFGLYVKRIPCVTSEVSDVDRISRKLDNAKKKVKNLENKIKGRKSRSYSKKQLKIIKSDIRYAKSIVKFWDSELDDAMDALVVSANSLGSNATDVRTKYYKLKKHI